MKNLLNQFALVFAVGLALTACTKTEKEIVYQNPPANSLESFSVASCAKKNCIKLDKNSLDKTFLLLTSGKSNTGAPQWMDTNPSVVIFQKSGAQVGLFSVSVDAIYGVSDAKELIQSFDIIDEDASSVTFDWGVGFNTLRMDESLQSETNLDPSAPKRTSVKILSSFVEKVNLSSEMIEVVQISKAEETAIKNRKDNPFDDKDPGSDNLDISETTLNLNIQIRPYKLDPDFKAKSKDDSKTVGFFVAPIAKPNVSGETNFLITKWDIGPGKAPVRVFVSANTPPEYVEAAKEGVLYWNKVLGFEGLTVEIGGDDRTVAPLHAVMVRWIPWDDAGFAYAMGQADPLTGELLRAQVFMTSAFTKIKGRAKKLAPVINPQVSCDFTKKFKALEDMNPDNPVDLRLAQDTVRSVVAHEMGHVMGLRHNFAGSASVSITGVEVLQQLKTYLADATFSGAMTSSTVMDYINVAEDLMLSKFIQTTPLPYDQMAMKWAYSTDDTASAQALAANTSKYCTDEDMMIAQMRDNAKIYECQQFDPTGGPFASLINTEVRLRAFVLARKYEEILGGMFPSDSPALINSLDRVLNKNHGDLLLEPLKTQIGYYKKKENIVSLDKWKNDVQRGFKTDVDSDLDLTLKRDLDQMGGFANIKSLLTPATMTWMDSDLQNVLNSIQKGSGTIKGRPYVLAPEQKTRLTQYFTDESTYLEAQLQKQLDEMFTGL